MSGAVTVAILRIEKCRPKVVAKTRKMSVAAVAEECGLSREAIHKDYPELIDQIKAETGKNVRAQRDQKNEDLKSERLKNRNLRIELAESKQNNQRLASINAALMAEVKELRAIVASKNITVIGQK
jgi:hypothetical protein